MGGPCADPEFAQVRAANIHLFVVGQAEEPLGDLVRAFNFPSHVNMPPIE